MSRMQQRIILPQPKRQAVVRLCGKSHTIAEAGALAIKEHYLGNFQAAADIYDLIRAKVPDSAEVHINCGVTLQAMKRYADALKCFDQAIALKPNHAEAYNNRGAVLQSMKRFHDALASYDQAILLKPDYANAHFNRGSTFKTLKCYVEAMECFDQAIALKPDHAEAYNNRGVVLQEMKRYDEALASFDKTIALKPDHAAAYNNRGIIQVIKGDMPAAEQMFLKVVALKPDFPDPWFNLVNIRKYQNVDNAEVKNIRILINKSGTSPEDKEHLYFSLGKIYDDCGRYDEAFECYRQANQIRNAMVAYDADGVRRMTNGIIDVFSKDFLAQPFVFASASQLPLFIVGMPRSGTTLLASILSNHRSIATAGELSTIADFASRLPELTGNEFPYPQGVKHMPPAVAMRLINDYERRLRRDLGSDGPRVKDKTPLNFRNLGFISRLFPRTRMRSDLDSNVAHVIDKNPLNFKNLGFISMLFPKARFIHCTRHPLDTGLSNYLQRFPLNLDYSFDLRNIGHFYGEYLKLMEHWRKVLPLPMIEVSYEDMILNTEQMTRKTLDILGLEWDERCLAPHTNPCAVETASQWQVRQPIYRGSLERWRRYEKHLGPLKEMLPHTG